MERVGALIARALATLGKASYFVGAALLPEDLVFAFKEVAVFLKFSSVGVEDSVELEEGIDLGVIGPGDFVVD